MANTKTTKAPKTGGSDNDVPAKDKKPAVTRAQFEKHAKPLLIDINGQKLTAPPKFDFSSGGFGWYATGKVTIEVDGTPVQVQFGGNFTVVHSKNDKPTK